MKLKMRVSQGLVEEVGVDNRVRKSSCNGIK